MGGLDGDGDGEVEEEDDDTLALGVAGVNGGIMHDDCSSAIEGEEKHCRWIEFNEANVSWKN